MIKDILKYLGAFIVICWFAMTVTFVGVVLPLLLFVKLIN